MSILARGKTCAKIINNSLYCSKYLMRYCRLSQIEKKKYKAVKYQGYPSSVYSSSFLSITLSLWMFTRFRCPVWTLDFSANRHDTTHESFVFCLSLWTSCFFLEIRHSIRENKKMEAIMDILARPSNRWRVLNEPRGFIRVIQWFMAIIAFGLCADYESTFKCTRGSLIYRFYFS